MLLLTAEEAGRVREAEAQARVGSGERYVDLYRLDRGVLTANGSANTIGNVLPMQAVSDDLWGRILAHAPDSA